MVSRPADKYLDILDSAPSDEQNPVRSLLSALQRAATADDPIETVAVHVAAPALVGYTAWVLERAHRLGLERLAFLSRDGQVLHELALRLRPLLAHDVEIDYVPCSRRTWNLAVLDPERMPGTRWLFNSFMRSNASDLCARLGLPFDAYATLMESVGVSLDPENRAGGLNGQEAAMNRFLSSPRVIADIGPRVARMRELTTALISQHQLDRPSTALVDAGWTGVMLSSLFGLIDPQGQPHIMLWGYQPRDPSVLPPDRVAAYRFDLRDVGESTKLRDEPFLIETFCMSDHGIVQGYRRDESGAVAGVFETRNDSVLAWGLRRYRDAIFRMCEELDEPALMSRMPVTLRRLLKSFWTAPDKPEALTWGSYPYDSDPTGTAVRSLASPFSTDDLAGARTFAQVRGDRAWIPGSLCLSTPEVAHAVDLAWQRHGGTA